MILDLWTEHKADTGDGLGWAHPIVREWFIERFASATEPQGRGWPHILAGRSTLISAPTGSGKTLAAFLVCIDRLVRKALAGQLENLTEVVYVSPLKALSNDVEKNLAVPLKEIFKLAARKGLLMPEIRTMVRTGDTPEADRRAMLKRPPHILVTTPESLYILLTAEKSRQLLKDVETVIVDEIHAMADDKRGAHLTLSLERLESITWKPPLRVGLSATQKPLTTVAHFLSGSTRELPVIVDVGHKRALDLKIETPQTELGPVLSNDMWEELYDRIAQLVGEHRSTLIFVNTRRLAERVAHNLADRLGEDQVLAHHGSLSRKLRLEAEHRLKEGELKALVATASLELGIDVGAIDLVIQISSPRAIAVALQRIGRAGHWRGAIPKGRIFASTRDDLIECCAVVKAINESDLDRLIIPDCPLDVLSQQIVATCATADWKESDLFEMVTRAYPYRNLSREQFDSIIEVLSEGLAASRGRFGAYLHRDRVNGIVRARRGTRLTAITNGGAIPETALYTVLAEPDGVVVGTVDEDFAVESMRGDIMLLGTTSWMVTSIEGKSGRMWVKDANGAPPSVPFWRGEAPARTIELSHHVSEIRKKVSSMLPQKTEPKKSDLYQAVEWLKQNCCLDEEAALQAARYIHEGRAVLGEVPTSTTLVAERFFDEAGGMQLVIHAPLGGRINKAWGLALRKRFCKSFNFELQAAATDNGINISLAEQHSFPLIDVFNFLSAETLTDVLRQAVLQSPIFTTRFRWDANRSLALLRYQGGKKVPPQIQRMRAEDLLAAVFPEAAACQDNIVGDIEVPDHPLVNESLKDALTEAMDLEGLKDLLNGIKSGAIRCLAVDTPYPSQFSHEILNANPYAYLDDAPLEERRARAVELRRILPASIAAEAGRLDTSAIEQVKLESWPDVRNEDELSDLLQTVISLPPSLTGDVRPAVTFEWSGFFEKLRLDKRAGLAIVDNRQYWLAAERKDSFTAIYGQSAEFQDDLVSVEKNLTGEESALDKMLGGWMTHLGPVSAETLSRLLGVARGLIEASLVRLESSGIILRGNFTGRGGEWCDRRLLSRIHKLTLDGLRQKIQPVSPADYMRWLTRFQHVAPGTQLTGERGLLEVLKQLQGFEMPANAWENQILKRRVRDYDPDDLDRLCLTGAVGWGRLSPHPATIKKVDDAPQQTRSGQLSVLCPGARKNLEPERWAGEDASSQSGEDYVCAATDERLSLVPIEGGRRVVPTSVSPITFYIREDCHWIAYAKGKAESGRARSLTSNARQVILILEKKGASFFADIVRFSGLLKSEVENALWELVAAGLVTADGFDNLRSLIDPKRRAGRGSARIMRPRHAAGRWSLLSAETLEEPVKSLESACFMLLRRYGVVFREVIARETVVPRWRELVVALRRLEDRGEIRGGRFVSGFQGEQFALPFAVESLRAMKDETKQGEALTLSAVDPVNLTGVLSETDRLPAVSGRLLKLVDGVPQASAEDSLDRSGNR